MVKLLLLEVGLIYLPAYLPTSELRRGHVLQLQLLLPEFALTYLPSYLPASTGPVPTGHPVQLQLLLADGPVPRHHLRLHAEVMSLL